MSEFAQAVATQQPKLKPVGDGKFGAQWATFPDSQKGVLKFQQFDTGYFRGIDKQTMHKREVAAYRLDRDLLHFNIVPETLLTEVNDREASIQQFVHGVVPKALVPGLFDKKLDDWKYRVAKLFTKMNLADVTKMVVFDLIIDNVDRHAKNVIIDTLEKRVYAIDNGLSFGRCFRYYRNVFHKYLFLSALEIPAAVLRCIDALKLSDYEECLGTLLSRVEVEHTYLRGRFVVEHKGRLGFKVLSQGHFDRSQFPSYEKWFLRKLAEMEQGSSPLVLVPGATNPQLFVDEK